MGFNVAMLAKISWRVLRKLESMLSKGRQILNQGLRWRVGNEELVRVADPWAPDLKVSELIRADRQG
ncbi:hypothetical protein DVH24_002643 [Malus domestica]|uniref:Uncharacterized protein n=1 Tax=Malus domestica TaxID=3750 RepID=A0A498K9T4_MALDO|nr:hypothetical protein DVH24_002643 [Malus domestica]